MSDATLPLRDYTLTHRAAGPRARNRRELREGVRAVPAQSLFLHFWGRLLRPGWTPGEYGNDLANWAAEGLHDLVLAERLALIDPRRYPRLDDLRMGVLDVLEDRPGEPGVGPAEALEGDAFHFLMVHVVVYDTGLVLGHPDELARHLPGLSTALLFRHFVDAPGSPVHAGDETRRWLRRWEGAPSDLAARLEDIDPFLQDEAEFRERLLELVATTLGAAGGNGRGGRG